MSKSSARTTFEKENLKRSSAWIRARRGTNQPWMTEALAAIVTRCGAVAEQVIRRLMDRAQMGADLGPPNLTLNRQRHAAVFAQAQAHAQSRLELADCGLSD